VGTATVVGAFLTGWPLPLAARPRQPVRPAIRERLHAQLRVGELRGPIQGLLHRAFGLNGWPLTMPRAAQLTVNTAGTPRSPARRRSTCAPRQLDQAGREPLRAVAPMANKAAVDRLDDPAPTEVVANGPEGRFPRSEGQCSRGVPGGAAGISRRRTSSATRETRRRAAPAPRQRRCAGIPPGAPV
jgi:hypothetical protein